MSLEIPKYEFNHSEVCVLGTKQRGTLVFSSDVVDDETVTFVQASDRQRVTRTAYMIKYNNFTSLEVVSVSSGLSASDIYICS